MKSFGARTWAILSAVCFFLAAALALTAYTGFAHDSLRFDLLDFAALAAALISSLSFERIIHGAAAPGRKAARR
jgi:hypothetical protein